MNILASSYYNKLLRNFIYDYIRKLKNTKTQTNYPIINNKLRIYVPTEEEYKNCIIPENTILDNNNLKNKNKTKIKINHSICKKKDDKLVLTNTNLIDHFFNNLDLTKPLTLFDQDYEYIKHGWLRPCYDCSNYTGRIVHYKIHEIYICKDCLPLCLLN